MAHGNVLDLLLTCTFSSYTETVASSTKVRVAVTDFTVLNEDFFRDWDTRDFSILHNSLDPLGRSN